MMTRTGPGRTILIRDLDIGLNSINGGIDDKTSTSNNASSEDDLDVYIFENYLYQGGLGSCTVRWGHLAGSTARPRPRQVK